MSGIANIMLANNICDVEEDIINNRFTLPYYLGKKNAFNLFKISILYWIPRYYNFSYIKNFTSYLCW